MKINGYKFGHPVFGDSDYFDFGPQCNIKGEIKDDDFEITSNDINFGDNKKMEIMLQNNEAKLIAEVFCSYTMFRKVYEQDLKYNISIPLAQLKNRVEAIFLVVANNDIPAYSNSSVKKEAREMEFYVEKGEVLAILGEYNFELDIKGTSLDSIIKIRPSASKSPIKVYHIFVEDSIIIELPQKNYDSLKLFAENPDYQKLLISSILQTALIHACYLICDKENEEYGEKGWARALIILWQKKNSSSDYPSKEEVGEFVEDLLKQPTNLLLNTLESMNNRDINIDLE